MSEITGLSTTPLGCAKLESEAPDRYYGPTSGVQLSYGITQSYPKWALWATIATHLRAKMAENGWKLVFDNTYFQNLLFYTQICSMGQQVVFNYPMVSPKVPITLTTPYNYPMGHHSQSFVSKNGQKWLKTGFWQYLPP
jgi:hypothetical protein